MMSTEAPIGHLPGWDERILLSAAGLDLILKTARSMNLPMPFTSTVSAHSPLCLQMEYPELAAWAAWMGESVISETGKGRDKYDVHTVTGDLLDVPVSLLAHTDRSRR